MFVVERLYLTQQKIHFVYNFKSLVIFHKENSNKIRELFLYKELVLHFEKYTYIELRKSSCDNINNFLFVQTSHDIKKNLVILKGSIIILCKCDNFYFSSKLIQNIIRNVPPVGWFHVLIEIPFEFHTVIYLHIEQPELSWVCRLVSSNKDSFKPARCNKS